MKIFRYLLAGIVFIYGLAGMIFIIGLMMHFGEKMPPLPIPEWVFENFITAVPTVIFLLISFSLVIFTPCFLYLLAWISFMQFILGD